jgi:NAD(P)H-hydrate epimerase
MNIPVATPAQIAQMDAIMNQTYHVSTLQLMEVAGLRVAEVIRDRILSSLASKKICVVVGKGNNGGDGLVAARYLNGWGADVSVVLIENEDGLSELSKQQLASVKALKIDVQTYQKNTVHWSESDIIIDAMLGCGLKKAPKSHYAEAINEINASQKMVAAVDIPSGLDGDTGEVYESCVRARFTVALAALKKGMQDQKAEVACGKIMVADIGIPQKVYEQVGVKTH